MANRGMSAAMIAEIAKQVVSFVHLIEFNLSVTEYYTSSYKDISYNGNDYFALGNLLMIGAIKESLTAKVGTTSLTLTGVNQSFISTVLSQNLTNKEISISVGCLDNGGDIIPNPVLIFKGRVNDYNVVEDSTRGTCEITLNLVDHWSDWDRIAGRRTNDNDQQFYYPGDDGFKFADKIVKDIKWGQND